LLRDTSVDKSVILPHHVIFSTGTTSSVGTIAKTYAPYTGSTTMAFSGSNGATGTCVIASDGSVKITPYGKAVSQYETITVPIYYG
jgi:hypothetical protein